MRTRLRPCARPFFVGDMTATLLDGRGSVPVWTSMVCLYVHKMYLSLYVYRGFVIDEVYGFFFDGSWVLLRDNVVYGDCIVSSMCLSVHPRPGLWALLFLLHPLACLPCLVAGDDWPQGEAVPRGGCVCTTSLRGVGNKSGSGGFGIVVGTWSSAVSGGLRVAGPAIWGCWVTRTARTTRSWGLGDSILKEFQRWYLEQQEARSS